MHFYQTDLTETNTLTLIFIILASTVAKFEIFRFWSRMFIDHTQIELENTRFRNRPADWFASIIYSMYLCTHFYSRCLLPICQHIIWIFYSIHWKDMLFRNRSNVHRPSRVFIVNSKENEKKKSIAQAIDYTCAACACLAIQLFFFYGLNQIRLADRERGALHTFLIYLNRKKNDQQKICATAMSRASSGFHEDANSQGNCSILDDFASLNELFGLVVFLLFSLFEKISVFHAYSQVLLFSSFFLLSLVCFFLSNAFAFIWWALVMHRWVVDATMNL